MAATALAAVTVATPPLAAQEVGEPPAPAPDVAASGTCTASVDNPHWSESGQSMDVKAHFRCNGVSDSLGYQVFLWLCPKQPPDSLTYYWLTQNCDLKAGVTDSIEQPIDDIEYIKMAPAPGGQKVPRQSGYWVGQAGAWWDGGPTHYVYRTAPKM